MTMNASALYTVDENKSIEEYKKEFSDNIDNFLKKNITSPLVFTHMAGTPIDHSPIENKKDSLLNVIDEVLYLSGFYCSKQKDGLIETGSSRWRSSLDIWRHIVFVLPNITIRDVMLELAKDATKNLYAKDAVLIPANAVLSDQINISNFSPDVVRGQFCRDVLRVVFKTARNAPGTRMVISRSSEFGPGILKWESLLT